MLANPQDGFCRGCCSNRASFAVSQGEEDADTARGERRDANFHDKLPRIEHACDTRLWRSNQAALLLQFWIQTDGKWHKLGRRRRAA